MSCNEKGSTNQRIIDGEVMGHSKEAMVTPVFSSSVIANIPRDGHSFFVLWNAPGLGAASRLLF